MKNVLLQHDARLDVAPGRDGPVPAGFKPPVEGSTVLSFRPTEGRKPDQVIASFNGTMRLQNDFGPNVCTYAVETDSFLAPLMIWDLAHTIPVGGSVTLAGSGAGAPPPYLAREYYRGGMVVESKTSTSTTFRKTAPLTVEKDRGLKRWTFGIPTGPGDATGLNASVKRILELGIPEFEIVLCGRPGANFKYLDKVRIVGEELSKPPVMIGRKKNLIAEAAQYENLCIFHDRVFLPKDFLAAAEKFGDDYPVATIQAIWFDDPYNLVPKRYSDYNRLRNPWPVAAIEDPAGAEAFYRKDLFLIDQQCGFMYAHPLRYHQTNYSTGSLYLSKRALWRAYPQSDVLGWSEYEDVEFGLRLSRAGIPSRVNPHTLTQTMFGRMTILNPHCPYDMPDGRTEMSVSPLEAVHFRRKPKIKWSNVEARERMATFARKNVPPEYLEQCLTELNRPGGDTKDWVRKIAVVVYASRIHFGEEALEEFVADIEKYLIADQMTTATKRFYAECFSLYGTNSRDHFVEHSGYLRAMLMYRPYGNLFYDSLAEYFPKRTWRLRLGTAWTARRLAKHNGMIFALAGGTAADYERAILNSTPFAEYYEA